MDINRKDKLNNILFLINVRWWNATAYYAVNIARILHKNGCTVYVGCDPTYPAYKKAADYGLNTVPLSFYGYNPVKLLRSFIRLRRLIKNQRIEVVNPHRSEDHFFALLAKYRHGASLVVTRGDQRKIKKGLLSRFKYALSDGIIATCRSIVMQNEHIFASMADKVHVIYGSVDEDHFRPATAGNRFAAASGIAPHHTTVGLVGRISRVKGQTTLIDAAAEVIKTFRDVRFIISGKEAGTTISQLRVQAAGLGIENFFVFLPEVPRVEELIDACDICVAASVGSETISRVVLEYLYAGKPVIGTRINAIGEIILPGHNGELCDPYDHRGLAEAILKLARDPDLRRRYGRNSRELYQRHYCEEIFCKSYLDVLSKSRPLGVEES